MSRHAVVVRRGSSAGLVCEVSCEPRRIIVVLAPRKDEDCGFPHATYHVDGTCHIKSLGATLHDERRSLPRLDGPFPRPVNVFALTVDSKMAELAKPPRTRLSDYADVIEIPVSEFDRGQLMISVDVVPPPESAPSQYRNERILDHDLRDTVPPVRITIWKPLDTSGELCVLA